MRNCGHDGDLGVTVHRYDLGERICRCGHDVTEEPRQQVVNRWEMARKRRALEQERQTQGPEFP